MPTPLELVLTAIKGKAPIAAIPVEGHAPACVDRKRLAAWSKGLTLTRAEVVTHYQYTAPRISLETRDKYRNTTAARCGELVAEGPHERSPGARCLVIEGTAGYARRSKCSMNVIDRRTAQKTLSVWSEKERVKIQKKLMLGVLGTNQKKAIRMAKIEGAESDALVTTKVHFAARYRGVISAYCGHGPEHRTLVEHEATHTVSGALVTLPGLDDLEFVLHRSLTRSGEFEDKGWTVSERRSGLAAGYGDSAEAALVMARTNTTKATPETLAEVRRRVEEQVAALAA